MDKAGRRFVVPKARDVDRRLPDSLVAIAVETIDQQPGGGIVDPGKRPDGVSAEARRGMIGGQSE